MSSLLPSSSNSIGNNDQTLLECTFPPWFLSLNTDVPGKSLILLYEETIATVIVRSRGQGSQREGGGPERKKEGLQQGFEGTGENFANFLRSGSKNAVHCLRILLKEMKDSQRQDASEKTEDKEC